MRLLIFGTFILTCLNSYAQTILGQVLYVSNNEYVEVFSTDYFTYTDTVINVVKLNDSLCFELNLNLEESQQVTFKINHVYYTFFVEPNETYKVEFPPYNGEVSSVLSKRKTVNPIIIKDGQNRINEKLEEFNYSVDNLITENAQLFVRKTAENVVAAFKLNIETKTTTEQSAFIRTYYHFVIAQLQLTTNYSRQKMMDEYVVNVTPKIAHPEYVKFFKDFFSGYRRFFAVTSLQLKLESSVNVHQNPDSLLSVLNTNKFLKQCTDKQKEMVLVTELYDMYQDATYNRAAIESVLKKMKVRSLYPDVQSIVKNILNKWNLLEKGSIAPEFEFKLPNGELKKLSDYRGKYVYIDFWATWCTPCINEMRLTKALNETYKEQVEILSISIDESNKKFQKFTSKMTYDWVFGRASNLDKLKEDYRIMLIPKYVLVGPDGEIIKLNAARPSSDIEKEFWKIKKANVPKSKDKEIWEMK